MIPAFGVLQREKLVSLHDYFTYRFYRLDEYTFGIRCECWHWFCVRTTLYLCTCCAGSVAYPARTAAPQSRDWTELNCTELRARAQVRLAKPPRQGGDRYCAIHARAPSGVRDNQHPACRYVYVYSLFSCYAAKTYRHLCFRFSFAFMESTIRNLLTCLKLRDYFHPTD